MDIAVIICRQVLGEVVRIGAIKSMPLVDRIYCEWKAPVVIADLKTDGLIFILVIVDLDRHLFARNNK